MVYWCNQIAGVPYLRYPQMRDDLPVTGEREMLMRDLVPGKDCQRCRNAAPGCQSPGVLPVH
jgi:hypothetical protein